MKRSYQIVGSEGKVGERHLAEFFRKNGQQLLPMVELIEQCRLAVDDVIEVLGRKTIETILEVSAMQVAGPRLPDGSPTDRARCPCGSGLLR